MLRSVGPARHVVVGLGIVGASALGLFGVIGAGDDGVIRSEHFDAKQVTVSPAGGDHPDGVAVREIVDIDFGLTERRGYQRIIPNDFGAPTEVTAFSPDANDELSVVLIGNDSRIRVGNPNITFTGRHRYELEYVLPEAQLSTGRLALDIIGTDETNRTDRFEVVLAGFEGLTEIECATGTAGVIGGCELVADGDLWRAVIEPLDPGEGISVFGSFDGLDPAADLPAVPAIPEWRSAPFWSLGLAILAVGSVTAAAIFLVMRRRGSNTVFGAGGAADAAHGIPLPAPGLAVHDVVTHRVPDDKLAELATIEFVPPRGIEPWHGSVLLRERVDDDSVRAWFGEMIARGTIIPSGEGKDMVLQVGPTDNTLSERDRKLLAELFRYGPEVPLGTYRKSFANLWKKIRDQQAETVDDAQWWERPIATGKRSVAGLAGVIFWILIGSIAFFSALAPILALLAAVLANWWSALAFSVLIVAAIAGVAYRTMLASRTATGSALTLRTESFRRFLEASEGRHVEWAWEQGVLRDYSAWAVALGAADAWSSAIRAADVPDRDTYLYGPMVMHTNASAFSSTTTAPSSSGSGGGGFSGGGVGGGGGGGSSGSW